MNLYESRNSIELVESIFCCRRNVGLFVLLLLLCSTHLVEGRHPTPTSLTIYMSSSSSRKQRATFRYFLRFLRKRGISVRLVSVTKCTSLPLSLTILWRDPHSVRFCGAGWSQTLSLPRRLRTPWLRARFMSNLLNLFLKTSQFRFRGQKRQRWHKVLSSLRLVHSLSRYPAAPQRKQSSQPRSRSSFRRRGRLVRRRRRRKKNVIRRRKVRSRSSGQSSTLWKSRALSVKRDLSRMPRRKKRMTVASGGARRKKRMTVAFIKPKSKKVSHERKDLVEKSNTPRVFISGRGGDWFRELHLSLDFGVRLSLPAQDKVYLGGETRFIVSFRGWRASLLARVEAVVGIPKLSLIMIQPALLFGPPMWFPLPKLSVSLDIGPSLEIFRAQVAQPVVWRPRAGGLLSLFLLWHFSPRWALSGRASIALYPQEYRLDRNGNTVFSLENFRFSIHIGFLWNVF